MDLINRLLEHYRAQPLHSLPLTPPSSQRDHGDSQPFDGRGGVLGHAFRPRIGRIHLDEDEHWFVDPEDNLFGAHSVLQVVLVMVLGSETSSRDTIISCAMIIRSII